MVKRRGKARVSIGDDACVLRDGTVVTTDAYAEGVHFDLGYMTLREVGTRCACAALSDIFAMAAEPDALLVALGVPAGMKSAGVRALYTGIEQACARLGGEVTGGDIIAADRLLLAITVTGHCRSPKLRSSARPGDRLYLSGWAGLAETGREVLRLGLSRRGYAAAVKRHIEPWPRAAVIGAIAPRVHALIDTSDGIATDARHLSEMSRVRVTIEPGRLPIHPETGDFCRRTGRDPTEFALVSGEDYELLLTGPGGLPDSVKSVPLTPIGRIEKGSDTWLSSRGRTDRLRLRGYDHLG